VEPGKEAGDGEEVGTAAGAQVALRQVCIEVDHAGAEMGGADAAGRDEALRFCLHMGKAREAAAMDKIGVAVYGHQVEKGLVEGVFFAAAVVQNPFIRWQAVGADGLESRGGFATDTGEAVGLEQPFSGGARGMGLLEFRFH
jgi:hypothetical protein